MDDLIVSPFDQSLVVSGPNMMYFLGVVENAIDRAVEQGDHRIAMRTISSLRRGGHMAGVGLAKALAQTEDRWKHFPVDESYTFRDACLIEAGISHETCRKYVPIWNIVINHPDLTDEQRSILMTKPIGTLDLLVAAAREGQIEDWEPILKAPDKATVRDIVRGIRGHVGPSETAVYIYVTRENTLVAKRGDVWVQDGPMPFNANMPFYTDEEREVAEIARERIIRAAGIIVR